MKNKFNIHSFLLEGLLKEQGEEEVDPQQMGAAPGQPEQDPAAAPDAQPPEPTPTEQEPTPQQAQQPDAPNVSAFKGMIGETIHGMEFKPSQNGGSVVIKTDHTLPYIISWEGDTVTVKHQGITKLR